MSGSEELQIQITANNMLGSPVQPKAPLLPYLVRRNINDLESWQFAEKENLAERAGKNAGDEL